MNTHNIIRQMKQRTMMIALLLCAIPCTTMQAGSLVRVLQFNLRLVNSGDGNNNWYYRAEDVAAFCHDLRADMFGMQEVTPTQKVFLKNVMTEYEAKFSAKGNPIFKLTAERQMPKNLTANDFLQI